MGARTILAAASAAMLLSGCITIRMTPAAYMVSPDIKQALAQYNPAKIEVASISGPADFSLMCRAVGDLRIENGLTLPEFVRKAFNDEFKYAGVYSNGGVRLQGRLTHVDFSSSASVVNGYWDLALTLESSNGKSMSVDTRYDFEAGFNGVAACNNTSQALAQAAHMLIRNTISDPRFATLIRQ